LSVLPVGLACQARCWFCFSESSISKEKEKFKYELKGLKEICQKSQSLGAERFVITGGGEPGLLQFDNLLDMIRLAKKHFPKVVLISNGMFLSKETDEKLIHKLKHLEEAGLDVLSISRHSPHSDVNKEIMGVNIGSGRIFDFMNAHKIEIKKRLICVLQKMGVSNFDKIAEYLDYATFHQVDQVCFKELYVSSSLESLYSKTKENIYSENQQVSLSVVLDFLEKSHFKKVKELPWGSPVYSGIWKGRKIEIAAYTEPSVGWERLHGIARSWNIMADGKCYASLEDMNSLVEV